MSSYFKLHCGELSW